MNWTLPSNECCVRNAEYVWEPQRYFRNDSPKLLLFIDVGMTDLPRTHERGKQIGVFFHDLFVYFISFNRCVIYREKYYFSFPWHIETVRRTATRTCLLVCVCFIIRLRWSLEHFSVDCRKLSGVALVSSSSLSDLSRKKLPPLSRSIRLKTATNRDLVASLHFPALQAVCLGLLWVLIGCLSYLPLIWLALVITMVLIYNTWLKCALRFSGCFFVVLLS